MELYICSEITDEDFSVHCVNTITEKEGGIDVLVNKSGYGSNGAIEDVPMEEARRQFDVTMFGVVRPPSH